MFGQPQQWQLRSVPVDIESDREIDWVLPARHTLSVEVLDEDGEPLDGTSIGTGGGSTLAVPAARTELAPGISSDAGFSSSTRTTDEHGIATYPVFESAATIARVTPLGSRYLAKDVGLPAIVHDTSKTVRFTSEDRNPSPGETPPPPPRGLSGHVVGRSTLGFTGPLGEVRVDIRQGGATIASATTDPAGDYQIPVVDGSYDVRFTPAESSLYARLTLRDVVIARAARADVVLTPNDALRVSGTVRSATGRPLAGVHVAVSGAENASITTAADGLYTAAVTPGTYTFALSGTSAEADLPPSWSLALRSTIIHADSTIDFTLPAAHGLTIGVVDAGDHPLSGVTLSGLELPTARTEIAPGIVSAAGSRSGLASVTTGAGGSAIVRVFTSTPAPAQIVAGAGNPSTQFEIPSIAGDTTITVRADGITRKRVSGVVRSAEGTLTAGVAVTIDGPESSQQTTAGDGSYSAAVTPGAYQIALSSGAAHPPTLPSAWSLPLQVTSIQADRTIDVDLPGVHTLTVQVLDQDGEPVPQAQITGLSLPTAVTEVAPGLASTAAAWSGPGSVTTGGDGVASIAVFSSKPAAAQIAAGPNNPATQFEVPSISRDTTLTVRANGLNRVHASGIVRTAGGVALPGVRVSVDGPESVTQITTATGSYLAAITPGVYRFGLGSGGTLPPGLPATWSLPLDAVSIQTDRSIDFALPAVYRLKVLVLGLDGAPLEGATITGLELPTLRTAPAPDIFTTGGARSGSSSVRTGPDGVAEVLLFPSSGGTGEIAPGPGNPRVRFEIPAITHDGSVTVRIADHVDDVAPHVVCAARDVDWHADNVSIGCTSTDGGMGLADPANAAFELHTSVPQGAETDAASTDSRDVCDRATKPNCAPAGPVTRIKVDRRAPAAGCDQPPTVWLATNASIVCSPSDGGSGLQAGAPFVLRTAVAPGAETAAATTDSRSLCDAVDNCAAAGPFTGLRIDRRPPSVVCAAADRAPRTSNATVACGASDSGSGLVSATDSTFVLRTDVVPGRHDAAAMTGSREVCDVARNCATAGPVGPFDIEPTSVGPSPSDKDGDGVPDARDFCPDRAGSCIPRVPTASERDRRATNAIALRVVAATCRPAAGDSAFAWTASRARPAIGARGSDALRSAGRGLCSSGLTALVALGDADSIPDARTANIFVVASARPRIQAIRAARARCGGSAACRSVATAAADLARAGDDLETAALELTVARNRLATAIVNRKARDTSLQSALVALLEFDVARAQTTAHKAASGASRGMQVAGASTKLPVNALRATTEALRAGRGIPASTARRLTSAGMSSAGLVGILKDLRPPAGGGSLGGLFKGSSASSRVTIGRTLSLAGLKSIVVNLASNAVLPPATTRKLLNDLLRASSACPASARRAAMAKFGTDANKITRTRMLAHAAAAVVLPKARCR